MMAPFTNTIGFICTPNSLISSTTVSPATILPLIIEIIKDTNVFNLNLLTAMEAARPYAPSSNAIITPIGNKIGIPVNTLLRSGVIIPKVKANTGERSIPPNKTGICIGSAIGPVIPTM